MSSTIVEQLPERLATAFRSLHALAAAHIYFAPVRHHSPACAFALRAQIEQLQPTHILIEAPSSFNPLITDLLNSATTPPVAILAQCPITTAATNDQEKAQPSVRSAFYPFCHYSPEWQALQQGHVLNAKLQFIDLCWTEQVRLEQQNSQIESDSKSLQAERYLAHSRYINQLAQKLLCRDHDDLWEHLFELRSLKQMRDWQDFFNDTFAWCALARLDYEPQVLEAEGSSQREQHMLSCIQQLKQEQPKAKVLVVTGGFHTLALVEALYQKGKLTSASKTQLAQFNKQQKAAENDQAWLIRYSFDRLDALNGYASGMPAPQFYQARWQSLLDQQTNDSDGHTQSYREQMSLQFLSKIAEHLRHEKFDDAPSFTALRGAYEQALGLASLRNHLGPSRYDLLDGLQTSFIKGSIDTTQAQLWQTIRQSFTGFSLGNIPSTTASPPLVGEVYQKAQKFRFKLDDTLNKTCQLDIYRNEGHRQRSRFLHLLDYLQIGFARKLDGPDFINGHRLDILFEDWQYAWTPAVEARLIELSEHGAQLEQLALKQLVKAQQTLEEQGQTQASAKAVQLLIETALMGLHSLITPLLGQLARYIEQDTKLDSLVNCGHKLLHLWRGREFLGLQQQPSLPLLLEAVQPQALFYLEQILQGEPEQQEQNLSTLLSLRELIKLMPSSAATHDHQAAFYQQLIRLQSKTQDTPMIAGAIDALQFMDDQLNEAQLQTRLFTHFATGSDSHHAISYFIGMMRTAPELMLQTPLLLNALDELMQSWEQAHFLTVLPDLRFAFSQLTPKQNAQLAEQIAEKHQLSSDSIASSYSAFSAAEMLEGAQLNLQLEQYLQCNHLRAWIEPQEQA